MTLGERIHDLRKKAGLSQEQLSERVGVSRQAVSKWEADAAVPETDKLVALAETLEVSTDTLLGRRPPEAPAGTKGGDAANWLTDLLHRRGYRVGYFIMGWGLFVLLAGGLVGSVWFRQLGGPLGELPASAWTPMLFIGFILLLGLAAVIGGITTAVRGKRNRG